MRCRIVLILIFLPLSISAQSLLNVRAIGMGSDITTAYDLPALYSNPAGLSAVRSWQVNNTNGFITAPANQGVFGDISIGHRFYDTHVAAFSYAPSRALQFRFITTTNREENDAANKSVLYELISDKKIRYHELLRIGYSSTPARGFSFGMSAQLQQDDIDEVSTTIITKESTPALTNVARDYNASSRWNFDGGFIYTISPSIQLGFVANNFLSISESEFPDKYRRYSLIPEKVLHVGASARPVEDLLLSAELDSKKQMTFGLEMNALSPTSPFVIRLGSRIDFTPEHHNTSLSFGTGYVYRFLTFDASYLTFLDKEFRNGFITEDRYSTVSNIEFNQYTSDRLSFSVSITLGSLRDAIARIENIDITNTVFPASYRIHATRPIGHARVRNLTSQPIQVRLRFYVRKLMNYPTESGEYYLGPDEVKDISFTAEFNESILSNKYDGFQDAELGVVASQVDNYEDVLRAKLLIHGRNSWNGDPLMLKYFVTPKDPGVIQFTRRAISDNRDFIESVPPHQRRFEEARTVFNKLANIMTYVGDPRTYDGPGELESVQYPSETLDLRTGDCDDLTVCYSALLNSLGIETAFVDVKNDSITTEGYNAHIYLLFDTSVPAVFWQRFTHNEKKIVLRKNSTGSETVWIPIETTITKNGFDEAWENGALEYLSDVELRLGLLRGAVRIIDVYQPE